MALSATVPAIPIPMPPHAPGRAVAGVRATSHFINDMKLAFLTMGFVLFCAIAIAAGVYANELFQNGSYKAVSFFLDFISVSNVGCKYVIWCIKH